MELEDFRTQNIEMFNRQQVETKRWQDEMQTLHSAVIHIQNQVFVSLCE